jgi:tetratricopeptide (TPR) repeat protein
MLAALEARSLILFDPASSRYRLLESIRKYGADRLAETDEEDRIRRLHRGHFEGLAERAASRLAGPEQQAWMDLLETEYDNLRSALERCAKDETDPEAGVKLALNLNRFWLFRHPTEGRSRMEALLAAQGERLSLKYLAPAFGSKGALAYRQGDLGGAMEGFLACLSAAKGLGDRERVCASLNNCGCVACDHGDYATARAYLEEGLAIAREIGNRFRAAQALNSLGNIALLQSELPVALAAYRDCFEIFLEIGDRYSVAGVLSNLGEAAFHQGDVPAARQHYDESLRIRRELGDLPGVSASLTNLAAVAITLRDDDGAKQLMSDALGVCREIGSRSITDQLENVAAAIRQMEPSKASRIWGAAQRMRRDDGFASPPHEVAWYDARIAEARGALADDSAFDAAWQAGSVMTFEEAFKLAEACCRRETR